jgi:hypothetical protein
MVPKLQTPTSKSAPKCNKLAFEVLKVVVTFMFKSNIPEPIQFYAFENRANKTNFWCAAMKSAQIQDNSVPKFR